MGNKIAKSVLICMVCCLGLPAQKLGRKELAGLVEGENTRQQAVSLVAESRREGIALLMELTTESFPGVDDHSLQVGLADVFGELRAEESIPFLQSHLILRRSEGADFAPWTKIDAVVLRSFPCIQALVSIGANASRALIKEYAGRNESENRQAAIFVVARIPNVPEAVGFLKGVSNPTALERDYINRGLELQTH
jgi:HEAT repeat protein